MTDVAIIGAGPYGLSIAAHLRESKLRFRIFGTPHAKLESADAEGHASKVRRLCIKFV